eukprot:TRINITY_DN5077_c2_g1_i1.p1 TRINITY_DN5077_c2_g1~~TRINITY_DN5077_c2_g1_i1.p1  ORF type:complete len:151 (+),score=16.73 TRINITY_DN5077_c2_g1_i1:29-454(+)
MIEKIQKQIGEGNKDFEEVVGSDMKDCGVTGSLVFNRNEWRNKTRIADLKYMEQSDDDDGLTLEFYKCFWDLNGRRLWKILINSMRMQSLESAVIPPFLRSSHRRGVVLGTRPEIQTLLVLCHFLGCVPCGINMSDLIVCP